MPLQGWNIIQMDDGIMGEIEQPKEMIFYGENMTPRNPSPFFMDKFTPLTTWNASLMDEQDNQMKLHAISN